MRRGSSLTVSAMIMLLYNANLYVDRGARDADTMHRYVCSAEEQRHGDGQKQPVVMKKR